MAEDESERFPEAMLKLTGEQRQAIILRYWRNATLPDIAEQLGKSQEAVAGLIFRGMQKLREPFKES
jgi:RNA polymerase sigma-70 factor, ECF subfamily